MKKKQQTESVDLTKQLQEDYLSYSMAVLVGRAIPDLYDGLKPAQRRILQTMLEEGLLPHKRYVKCARVTGLTMAFLHPHGGCYGSLVNMATTWNNNVPWIDGHGNFGSSVDNPAAERYTECRLRESAVDMLLQDKVIWETKDNYDGSRQEAVRFNAAVPSVLLNGESGIAVGFATKLAPHNLRSIQKALHLLREKNSKKISLAKRELIPDFPTGCDIVDDEGLQQYLETGKGNIRCRAKVSAGTQKREGRAKNRPTLTFTNLPPGVNPEKLGEQIRDSLEKERLNGVAEIIDESDLTGDRLTVVGKVDCRLDELSQRLFYYTDLELNFSARTLVIDGIKPVELSPVEVLAKWSQWRLAVLERKFRHELNIANDRLHIVEGLQGAISKLDAIIKKIRASAHRADALAALMKAPFKFSEKQAEAILAMRLGQLTNLDANALQNEKTTLWDSIAELETLIKDEGARSDYMHSEIKQLATRHGNARRCELIKAPEAVTITKEKRAPAAAKPRFVKVDAKRGVVEQVKGPRGAMVVDSKEKIIFMSHDGTLRKVPATFKGPISKGYSEVALAKREAEVQGKKFLAVFSLGEETRAMVLEGDDLCRCTSTGKRWLPEGAECVYFGEGPYLLCWKSPRKKATKIDLSFKGAKPGAKGLKVGLTKDIGVWNGTNVPIG